MAELKVEVVEVTNVRHHNNADRLDVVQVYGYDVVTGRDEYKDGDLAVYFPVDAILPQELEDFIFAGGKMKLNKNRVRPARIRGWVSQGLLVSLDVISKYKSGLPLGLGKDLTKELGVTKRDVEKNKPKVLQGRQTSKKETNPFFRKYTSIQHLKKYGDCFEKYQEVIVTEKIHGTNFRCGWVPTVARTWIDKIRVKLGKSKWPLIAMLGLDEFTFVFGSHNVQLKAKDNTYYNDGKEKAKVSVYEQCVIAYDLADKIPFGYVAYGEIFGPGIQKGYGYGLKDGEFDVRFFDVQNSVTGMYVDFFIMQDMLTMLGLKVVPWEVTAYNKSDLNDAMNNNRMKSRLDDKTDVEGLVIRSYNETTYLGGRAIMKWISDRYLLKKGMTEFK